jgi:hypothetical protein
MYHASNQKHYIAMLALAQQQAKPRKPAHVSNNDALIDDDTLMTKEELLATIESETRAIKEGKGTVLRTKEDTYNFFMHL